MTLHARPDAPFLVVEDDVTCRRAYARVIGSVRRVVQLASVAEVRAWIARAPDCIGVILDKRLPDGDGLDLIAPLRELFGSIPILVVTGEHTRSASGIAAMHGALYVEKPVDPAEVVAFAMLCVSTLGTDVQRGARLAAILRTRWHLTLRQVDLVARAMGHETRDDIAAAFGVESDSVRVAFKGIVTKCAKPNMRALLRDLAAELRSRR